MYIEGMSTSTRVLCLLSALLPAITLGESSDRTGDTCPASAVKSPAPACSTPIPSSEETVSFLLEVQGDDGKPLSNQQEAMEWVRLRLAMAGKQPDGITILPEGSHGMRVQLRGEAMQQADDLEAYLLNDETFQILPVHPHNDLLLANRDPETGIVQNMPDNAQIMLQFDPIHHQASEIIVQTDKCVIDYQDTTPFATTGDSIKRWPMENTHPKDLGEHNYANPIITKHDIENALVDEHDPNRIRITFTLTGRFKLQQYMSTMKPGRDRMAVVMDNRVIATLILPSKLDKELSFPLNTPQRAQQTAQWLSAKNIYLIRVGQKEHTPVAATAE